MTSMSAASSAAAIVRRIVNRSSNSRTLLCASIKQRSDSRSGRRRSFVTAIDGRAGRIGRSFNHRTVSPMQTSRSFFHTTALRSKDVKMTWVVGGERIEVEASEGKTLLEVAHENDIELEGACGGELACSTCHVVFPKEIYDQLPEKQEEEEDMLDLAWGLTDTSRLGCQIKATPLLEGVDILIPEESNNLLGEDPSASTITKEK